MGVGGWPEHKVLALEGEDFGDAIGSVYNKYLAFLLDKSSAQNVTCADVPFERCARVGTDLQAVVYRQLCPRRCGCDTVYDGVIYSPWAIIRSGCPPWVVRLPTFQASRTRVCEDTNNISSFVALAGTYAEKYNLSQRFKYGGCEEVVKPLPGAPIVTKLCEWSTITAWCPRSCGCNGGDWSSSHADKNLQSCPNNCTKREGRELCFTVNRRSEHNDTYSSERGPLDGLACLDRYTWKGRLYDFTRSGGGCITTDWPVPWCFTMQDESVSTHAGWGECPDTCPISIKTVAK